MCCCCVLLILWWCYDGVLGDVDMCCVLTWSCLLWCDAVMCIVVIRAVMMLCFVVMWCCNVHCCNVCCYDVVLWWGVLCDVKWAENDFKGRILGNAKWIFCFQRVKLGMGNWIGWTFEWGTLFQCQNDYLPGQTSERERERERGRVWFGLVLMKITL